MNASDALQRSGSLPSAWDPPVSYLDQTEETLREVLASAAHEGKLSGFCIGNTAKIDGGGLFFSPIRRTRQLVAGSVLVYRAQEAAVIAQAVDGHVDYILVDSEKKAGPERDEPGTDDGGGIERAVRGVVQRSRILTYKGNDLTVDSVDCLLAQLIADPVRGMGGKKAAIIGAGNLGSKLALKLVERGASVVLTRRSQDKLNDIVRGLNTIKPFRTTAEVVGTVSNEEAARDADILIGAASGTPVITAKMIDVVAAHAVVADVGKGCLFPDAIQRAEARELRLLRADIRSSFHGQVALLLEMERLLRSETGRREIGGIRIVSGGLLGRSGEFVVDSVCEPTTVFGIADGRGDFVRDLSAHQREALGVLSARLRVP